MEHASFHQEQYGDSFFEFISEHYGEEFKNHSNEHEEHEDLPFKHDHQTPSIFMLNSLSFQLKKAINVVVHKNFFYKEPHSLFEKPSVFQPPKQA